MLVSSSIEETASTTVRPGSPMRIVVQTSQSVDTSAGDTHHNIPEAKDKISNTTSKIRKITEFVSVTSPSKKQNANGDDGGNNISSSITC